MKNVSAKDPRHDKAYELQAQGPFCHLRGFAACAASTGEERPELKRSMVEPLPPQFEWSLSKIARRM